MGSKPLLIFIIFLNLGPSVLKELYVMSMCIHACGGVEGVYVSVCVCGMGDRQTDRLIQVLSSAQGTLTWIKELHILISAAGVIPYNGKSSGESVSKIGDRSEIWRMSPSHGPSGPTGKASLVPSPYMLFFLPDATS